MHDIVHSSRNGQAVLRAAVRPLNLLFYSVRMAYLVADVSTPRYSVGFSTVENILYAVAQRMHSTGTDGGALGEVSVVAAE